MYLYIYVCPLSKQRLFRSFAHFLTVSLLLLLFCFGFAWTVWVSLHILILPASQMYGSQIFFSHFIGCLFILFPSLGRIFFIWYSPTYFCSCLCFWCHVRETTVKTNAKELFPCIFFVGILWFQALHLLIYFKLIFVYDIYEANFILLHVDIHFSQHHLLKKYLFPILSSWHSCQRLVDCMCGFVSGLFILFYWSVCLFLC